MSLNSASSLALGVREMGSDNFGTQNNNSSAEEKENSGSKIEDSKMIDGWSEV